LYTISVDIPDMNTNEYKQIVSLGVLEGIFCLVAYGDREQVHFGVFWHAEDSL